MDILEGHKKLAFLQYSNDNEGPTKSDTVKMNFQANRGNHSRPNRYALEFFRESNEEIRKRKELARSTLEPKNDTELEVNGDDYYTAEYDFPKRPEWSYDITKEELEAKENKYFTVIINACFTLIEVC